MDLNLSHSFSYSLEERPVLRWLKILAIFLSFITPGKSEVEQMSVHMRWDERNKVAKNSLGKDLSLRSIIIHTSFKWYYLL